MLILTDLPDIYSYHLFAVVNHSGTLETGHYSVFVRHSDYWYKCDDHFVMKATEQEVLRSEGCAFYFCYL